MKKPIIKKLPKFGKLPSIAKLPAAKSVSPMDNSFAAMVTPGIPVAVPPSSKLTDRMKMKVGLDILFNNKYIFDITFVRSDNITYATVDLPGNDIQVTGKGVNISKAIADLNTEIINLNFEI